MAFAYSTGNEIVDQVAKLNITGNVIPLTWFQTMTGESGKPMLLAIDLLADIVYWYRPQEVRDEGSGDLMGYRKKFKADYLQRSYRQIEERFGVTRKQARTALDFLCDKGVIRKHLREEVTGEGMKLFNCMYLELVPEVLVKLTFPEGEGGVPYREPPSAPEGTGVVPSKTQGGYLKGTTYTESTTKNSVQRKGAYRNPFNRMEKQDYDVLFFELVTSPYLTKSDALRLAELYHRKGTDRSEWRPEVVAAVMEEEQAGRTKMPSGY